MIRGRRLLEHRRVLLRRLVDLRHGDMFISRAHFDACACAASAISSICAPMRRILLAQRAPASHRCDRPARRRPRSARTTSWTRLPICCAASATLCGRAPAPRLATMAKPRPAGPGARGLHTGVERQQVRLERDVVDDIRSVSCRSGTDSVLDLLHALYRVADDRRRSRWRPVPLSTAERRTPRRPDAAVSAMDAAISSDGTGSSPPPSLAVRSVPLRQIAGRGGQVAAESPMTSVGPLRDTSLSAVVELSRRRVHVGLLQGRRRRRPPNSPAMRADNSPVRQAATGRLRHFDDTAVCMRFEQGRSPAVGQLERLPASPFIRIPAIHAPSEIAPHRGTFDHGSWSSAHQGRRLAVAQGIRADRFSELLRARRTRSAFLVLTASSFGAFAFACGPPRPRLPRCACAGRRACPPPLSMSMRSGRRFIAVGISDHVRLAGRHDVDAADPPPRPSSPLTIARSGRLTLNTMTAADQDDRHDDASTAGGRR